VALSFGFWGHPGQTTASIACWIAEKIEFFAYFNGFLQKWKRKVLEPKHDLGTQY
jgi:hypothetical protein